MKTTSQSAKPPFSFELGAETAARLLQFSEANENLSNTALVELALGRFDFDKVEAKQAGKRQFSVRLSSDLRSMLEEQSRLKGVSIGHLIRLALEDFAHRSTKKISKDINHLTHPEVATKPDTEKGKGQKKKKQRKSEK